MGDATTSARAVPALPRFRGLRAAGESYIFVFVNIGAALRAAGIWTLLLTILIAVVLDLVVYNSTAMLIAVGSSALSAVIGLPVASAAIAVAWHRFVLRGERPPRLPFALAPSLRYLLVVMVALITLGTAVAGANAFGGWTRTLLAVAAVLVLVLLGFLLRFALVLPALALGDEEMTLRRSWRETARLWRGLLLGTVIIGGSAALALALVVGSIDQASNAVTRSLIFGTLFAAIFVFVMIYATFLSLGYRATVGSIDRISEAFA